ncbi:MAG: FMN-binding protein [Oscillospiraceae bacterium]|jgi:electron transport complex protein RnfG|nr:FMN-binding protein [Oscillospiraceae bacterium]
MNGDTPDTAARETPAAESERRAPKPPPLSADTLLAAKDTTARVLRKTGYMMKVTFDQGTIHGVVITLFLITSVTALLLGIVNRHTADLILAAEENRLRDAMRRVIAADAFSRRDTELAAVYTAERGGAPAGYAVVVGTEGFSGTVTLVVGFDPELAITGVEIIAMTETPGYGARATSEPWFLGQFAGKYGSLQYGQDIEALAGATVTSQAVLNCINEAREAVWRYREGGGE